MVLNLRQSTYTISLIATVPRCMPVNECQRGDRKCLAHTVVGDEPVKGTIQ